MKVFMRIGIIGVIGLLIGGFNITAVRAAEKETGVSDRLLNVVMTRSDGVNITPQNDEVICVNSAVTYTVNQALVPELYDYVRNADEKNDKVDELLQCRVVCQYAVSTDGGDVFTDWADLSGNTFTLIPGSVADGQYVIKFRKLQDYTVRSPDSIIGAPPESVSENKAYDKKKKEYENLYKKAQSIAQKESSHTIESCRFRMLLDTGLPSVDLTSDKDLGSWTCDNIKCLIKVNDTVSKPAWLKVTCDGNKLIEEKYDINASFSGSEKELLISSESIKDEGSPLIIEAADNAGNVTVIQKTVKIDKTAPVIDLEGVDSKKVSRSPVNISVTGEDAHPGNVSVEYTVKKTYEGNEEVIENEVIPLNEAMDGYLFTASGDGDYLVECRAYDSAGNASQPVKRSFRIDTISPGLNFTGINDGSILNREGELKINAFDNYENAYKVTLNGSVGGKSGTKDLRLADYKTDGKYSVNTYYFNADGEYTVTASVEDEAGNSFEDSISFSIDTAAPVIDIMGGVSLKEDLVTNVAPDISFRVKESNFETAAVICELFRVNDKKRELCKSPEWIMDRETSDFSLTIDEEGDYELSVTAADAAGNTAGKTVKFTLDTTKPEIDYVENLDKKYVRSFKLPENFSDYIKDKSGVNYKTYINSMNYDEGSRIDEDGKYVLKVSAVDDAGNEAEKTVEFIVDATMPRVVIDGMADDGSVNKDDTIVLSLYDQDDYFKSVKLNGEELISEDKQQTVQLTIPEYGDYTIEVEASDLAENVLTQTIEAKCANASPVSKGTSTVRTLKQNEGKGSNKGLRIFLIVLTVLILGGSIAVYCIYSVRQEKMYQ